MKCPKCGGEPVKSIKRTSHIDDTARTYVCQACGESFETIEVDTDLYMHMAKMAGEPGVSSWERIILMMADKCEAQIACDRCELYCTCQRHNLQMIWRKTLDEIDDRRRER